MNIYDRKGLKEAAASRLSDAAYDPRKLTLIHTAVASGAALLVAAITYILEQRIAATGGLSGIGLRSVLTTAQSILQFALTFLSLFWGSGIIFAAIGMARSRTVGPADLTAGFRRFGPVLRLKLLQLFLLGAIAMPCLYVSIGIFSMTPLATDYVEVLTPIMEQALVSEQPMLEMDTATTEALAQAMLPLIPIFILVFLAALLPLLYRVRFAEHVLMDDEPCGAMAAMVKSWKLTRGHAFGLFRLDLSFWWFYVLQGLISLLAYGDALLPRLGISLPMSADSAYFLFYLLYAAAELLLFWRFAAYLHTTFAVAYDTLRVQAVAPPKTRAFPWDLQED